MSTAILQVRMGSTRLPGKALFPIVDGKSALELMLERVRRAQSLKQILVATTSLREDDVIVELSERLNLPCFRGSPHDVLDRFYQCARTFDVSGSIVRLTGDCPLHDSEVIDQIVDYGNGHGFDYVSNLHPPSYPDGLDTEVFSFAALERAWSTAKLPIEREHVTYFIYTHPERFRIGSVTSPQDLSHLRWTLDHKEDLEFIRLVYQNLYPENPNFKTQDILRLLKQEPRLMTINNTLQRNESLRVR